MRHLTRLFACIFLSSYLPSSLQAQAVSIPEKIRFADMVLHIKADAKEEIQKKVTSLIQSPAHYKEIFDKVNLYMPFIEKILQEEEVPDDLKYLVIQESVLTPDCISGSDAVGFWQFKEPSALEAKLRIDHQVDERMHIIASTRGFARFVKNHYHHFNNWLYALLAYHLGGTGAKNFIKETGLHVTQHSAVIDKKVHWYIYHFIAHKLVFEKAIGKELHPEIRLYEYHEGQGKHFNEISKHFNVSLHTVLAYNKWIKHPRVPENVGYPLLIPLSHQAYNSYMEPKHNLLAQVHSIDYSIYITKAKQFPVVTYKKEADSLVILINGLQGMIAQPGHTLQLLAQQGGISMEELLTYNEIDATHTLVPGQAYYFERKNSKARLHYHVVQKGESWESIAQKYGVRQKSLWLKNRLRQPEALTAGRVIWMRFIRPASIPVAYEILPDSADPGSDTTSAVAQPSSPSTTNLKVDPPVAKDNLATAAYQTQPTDTAKVVLDDVLDEETVASS